VSLAYDNQLLDHKHRNTKLGRWVSPVPRIAARYAAEEQGSRDDTANATSRKPTANTTSIARVVKSLLQPLHENIATATVVTEHSEFGYWSPAPEYKLSAEFGHALFPLQDVQVQRMPQSSQPITSRALLSHSLPGISTLMISAYLQGATPAQPKPCIKAFARTHTPSLLYEFIPAPEQQNLERGQSLPRLRIQMRTSPTGGDAVLHRISLGFQEHVHDVLLPDQAADVQFCRYGRLRFRKSHHDKNVHEWVKAVCENIASGERLTAPSLTIDIPTWTIPAYPAKAKGMLRVTYLFSGIQFRQTVSGSFMDTQISYSTTQSGKMGARGGALTMHYVGVGQSVETLLRDEDSLKSFVEKSFGMVDHITEAAMQTQPTFRMLRPRSEESGRKARRSVQQATEDPKDASEVVESGEERLDTPIQRQEIEGTNTIAPSTNEDIYATILGIEADSTAVQGTAAIDHTAAENPADLHLAGALSANDPGMKPEQVPASNDHDQTREVEASDLPGATKSSV
jgi:hypothetical protein